MAALAVAAATVHAANATANAAHAAADAPTDTEPAGANISSNHKGRSE